MHSHGRPPPPPPPYHHHHHGGPHDNVCMSLCCWPCMTVTSILGGCISCLCYPVLRCFGLDRHYPPPPPHYHRY
ncbi:hypothetical protein HanRHA438_Chr14g0679331 [Helianthus annuus]|uniref:Uncharacterized protein n=1 Tax=Helianthus annuus TaxID=4232 RepID=A0A251SM67_HELAN|nr:hypothetical protein HanXRQr2_Chr14g0667711 [Helianthus annuus]KAJ0471004.1 hypothetical protein HanIR_Chr14g0724901 [Helianthus annuus]KAJ0842354.1 hypothetical protein HanPSC8_Chr14g0640681 [Helianthus annuus]KAJ0855987.1 hypothetical protein HanRHA438_Chr14g0679331 [Helianthus annuus]